LNRRHTVFQSVAQKIQLLKTQRLAKHQKEQLTPQLTPNSQKQPEIDTENLPDDLAEVVAAWPELPEHIKKTIKTLIEAHITASKD